MVDYISTSAVVIFLTWFDRSAAGDSLKTYSKRFLANYVLIAGEYFYKTSGYLKYASAAYLANWIKSTTKIFLIIAKYTFFINEHGSRMLKIYCFSVEFVVVWATAAIYLMILGIAFGSPWMNGPSNNARIAVILFSPLK